MNKLLRLICLLLFCLPLVQVHGQVKKDLGQVRSQMRSLKQDLEKSTGDKKALKRQLDQLQADIHKNENSLAALNLRRQKLGRQLTTLRQELRILQSRIETSEERLSRALREQWLHQRTLHTYTPQPSQYRNLLYASFAVNAQGTAVEELRQLQRHKEELTLKTQGEREKNFALEKEEQSRQEKLGQQRASKNKLLAKLETGIATREKKLASLKQHEKQLSMVLKKLQAKQKRKKTNPRSKPNDKSAIDTASNFSRSKGQYPLPVEGKILDRPPADLVSRKGIFIRASEGGIVKAIAAGHVVFADTMRGYGRLIIVDHGEGYYSIYGSCSLLMKSLGEAIKQGEELARVGKSSDESETGLYFELRRNAVVLKPSEWFRGS